MATGQVSRVLQHLRRTAFLQDSEEMTDGQLLDHFLTRGEEAAFEALVRRHGTMVLSVCRRVLNNTHDAEDAFQATFLVLVRKASSLLPRGTVGNWLYGVAYHTALKARAATVKRRAKEAQVRDMPKREGRTEEMGPDWQPLLDLELSRLPDKYREPVVLCDLEGKTRREAAQHLGVPEGTLSGRLTTARRMLAKRLARHGVTLSAGALATVLSQQAATAGVPAPLMVSTVKAAGLLASGATAAAVVSTPVAALTDGVLKAMLMAKLKVTAVALLVIGGLVLGSGTLVHRSLADTEAAQPAVVAEQQQTPQMECRTQPPEEKSQEPTQEPKEEPTKEGPTVGCTLQSLDADKTTIAVTFANRPTGGIEKSFALDKDIVVLRDGKPANLAELKKGSKATLTLSPDQQTVVSINVASPTISAPLKSVDVDESTITIRNPQSAIGSPAATFST